MEPTTIQTLEKRIFTLRESKVMLDMDLAELYGVTTAHLNRAVQRNAGRFPPDFMFQLDVKEVERLRCQIGISKIQGRGGRRYLPKAFTEQGVAMLSGVLHSDRAVQVNVAIMRAFVKLREAVSAHKDLSQRVDELERKCGRRFKLVFEAIRELLEPSVPPKPRIGFRAKEAEGKS